MFDLWEKYGTKQESFSDKIVEEIQNELGDILEKVDFKNDESVQQLKLAMCVCMSKIMFEKTSKQLTVNNKFLVDLEQCIRGTDVILDYLKSEQEVSEVVKSLFEEIFMANTDIDEITALEEINSVMKLFIWVKWSQEGK